MAGKEEVLGRGAREVAAACREVARAKPGKGCQLDLVLPDLWGGRLRASAEPGRPGVLLLELAGPSDGSRRVSPDGVYHARAALQAALPPDAPADAVQVVSPRNGYEAALELALAGLGGAGPEPPEPQEGPERLERVAEAAARAADLVASYPLHRELELLARGRTQAGRLECVPYCADSACFVQHRADSLIIVFPMAFRDGNEAALAQSFLEKFAEARASAQGPASRAPSVNYLPPGKPPLELAGPAVPEVHRQANGGFVSFVLTSRHVEGAKLEAVVWRLWAFPKYISAHLKVRFPRPCLSPPPPCTAGSVTGGGPKIVGRAVTGRSLGQNGLENVVVGWGVCAADDSVDVRSAPRATCTRASASRWRGGWSCWSGPSSSPGWWGASPTRSPPPASPLSGRARDVISFRLKPIGSAKRAQRSPRGMAIACNWLDFPSAARNIARRKG